MFSDPNSLEEWVAIARNQQYLVSPTRDELLGELKQFLRTEVRMVPHTRGKGLAFKSLQLCRLDILIPTGRCSCLPDDRRRSASRRKFACCSSYLLKLCLSQFAYAVQGWDDSRGGGSADADDRSQPSAERADNFASKDGRHGEAPYDQWAYDSLLGVVVRVRDAPTTTRMAKRIRVC